MQEIFDLLSVRNGHFLLESGHHGDLWLDLELLCHRPRQLRPMVLELARRLSKLDIEVVCGPLVEGAFVGIAVAEELELNFVYSERFARPAQEELFPAGYRIPAALRNSLRQKRVAIVNDVINVGSAVRGTFADLENCGATVAGVGTLLVLGDAAFQFALSKNIVLESLATCPSHLWSPAECPLCSSGAPLHDPGGFRLALPRKAHTNF